MHPTPLCRPSPSSPSPSSPWIPREAPEVLHGYTESWKKKKAADMGIEERLDLRCGSKADKFCK